MGKGGRPCEGHQDVTRPTGPKGRLAERSEVRERPLPTTGARSGDRRLAGGSKEGGDRVKQASQEPSVAAGGEPREVQLRGAAEPCRHPPLPVSCSGYAQQKGAELKRSVEPGSKRSEETRSRLRKVAMTTGWQELMEPEAEKHPQETEARTDTRTQTPIHAVVFSFLK